MTLSSTLLAILGVLSPSITSATQIEILCNRNTTDTTCLSPASFAYCNAWNALGPSIDCESGTTCRESHPNGVSRIACLPGSITGSYDADVDRPGMGLQCVRQTTESLCVSGTAYSLCMANGELSWPTECAGECHQWVFGMVTRAYCDSEPSEDDPMAPPTVVAQVPGGSCDNESHDTICLTSRTFGKCYASDEIGNEHACPTDSRCVDQTVLGVNRVVCEPTGGKPKSVYWLLGDSVFYDWTAGIFGRVGAGSRCEKAECFDSVRYSVCFADGMRSEPMRCPEGLRCVELEEGGVTCEPIVEDENESEEDDEDENESEEDDEDDHAERRLHERCETCVVVTSTATAIATETATTTAARPVYVVTEIVTASPVIVTVTATSTMPESVSDLGNMGCGSEPTCGSSGGSGGCESGCSGGGSDDSGAPHGSDESSCDSGCVSGGSGGWCSSGCGSGGSGGCSSGCGSGGSGGGERCDPSKIEGMCKGSQNFVHCLSDGSLSEPMSCAEGTVCKGTTVNGVERAVCWWPAPDESAAIKPGDYCEANWVDSMCLSFCTFAKCFGVNLVGPVQACGEGTTCIESTVSGKKSVTCGWPEHKVLDKRDGTGNPNLFPGFSMTTEVDVGRPCNNANVWSVCKNSTTYLECWPGGVFGPYRTCGVGTVCYEQSMRGYTGVYCGWPAGSNQVPGPISGEQSDNTVGVRTRSGTTVTVFSTVVAVRRPDSTPTLKKREEDEAEESETTDETSSDSGEDDSGKKESLLRRQEATGPTVFPTTFPTDDPTAPPIQNSAAATTSPPSPSQGNGDATSPPPQSTETNYPSKPCDVTKIRNVCMNARTFLTCISDGTLEEPRDCAEGTVCYNMYDAPDGLLDILCDFENLLSEPGISGLQLGGVLMDSPAIVGSAVSTVVVTVTAPQQTIFSTVIVTTTVLSNVVTVTSTAVETAFATAAAVATVIVTEVVTMNVS